MSENTINSVNVNANKCACGLDDCQPDELEECPMCNHKDGGTCSTCRTRSESGFYCENRNQFFDICCGKLAIPIEKFESNDEAKFYDQYWMYQCKICCRKWKNVPD